MKKQGADSDLHALLLYRYNIILPWHYFDIYKKDKLELRVLSVYKMKAFIR